MDRQVGKAVSPISRDRNDRGREGREIESEREIEIERMRGGGERERGLGDEGGEVGGERETDR